MVLRINAALVFLSICLGDVLLQFASKDVTMLSSVFSAHSPGAVPDNNTIKLALLFLPVILTMIFMIKTVKGHGKLALNLLPAVGVGVLSALLAVPLLPLTTKMGIIDSSIWDQGQQYQGYIVGLSASVCLLTVWMQRPKHGHDEKHAKGKH
jgi:hypothetical protein